MEEVPPECAEEAINIRAFLAICVITIILGVAANPTEILLRYEFVLPTLVVATKTKDFSVPYFIMRC